MTAAIARVSTAASPWFFEADYANDINDMVIDSSAFSPAEICEQILDKCLTPTKYSSDGDGCDNMTVVVVLLNGPQVASSAQ